MVRIRENQSDFFKLRIFELIESYRVDIYKSNNNSRWTYFWWKIEFRHKVLDALKKKNGQVTCSILICLFKM